MKKNFYLKNFLLSVSLGFLSIVFFSINYNFLGEFKLNTGEFFIYLSIVLLEPLFSFFVVLFGIIYFILKLNFFFSLFLFFEWVTIIFIYRRNRNFLYSFFLFWLVFAPVIWLSYFCFYKDLSVYITLNLFFFRFFLSLLQLILVFPFSFLDKGENVARLNLKNFLIYFSIVISTISVFVFMKLYISKEIKDLKMEKVKFCKNEIYRFEKGFYFYFEGIKKEIDTILMLYNSDNMGYLNNFKEMKKDILFLIVENVFSNKKEIIPLSNGKEILIPDKKLSFLKEKNLEFLVFNGYLFLRKNEIGGMRYTFCINLLKILKEVSRRFYFRNSFITDKGGRVLFTTNPVVIREKKIVKICQQDNILPIIYCSAYSEEKLLNEESIFIFKYFLFAIFFLSLSILISFLSGNLILKPFDKILKKFQEISEDPKKDFNLKVKSYYLDVIERFIISFSNMHSRIKSLYLELVSSLEKQKEYSNRLKELNENLEEKVNKRTKELKDKNEELKKINELLKRYNRFLDSILESELDGILICNADRKVFKVNRIFFKLFGFKDKLELKSLEDVNFRLKDKFKEDGVGNRIFLENFSNENFLFKDYLKVKINDNEYDYFCYSSPVIVNSRFSGRLWMFRDETKEKKLRDEIISVNKELKSFIHIISHDLKNPIAVMLGVIELFKENQLEKLDEDGKEQLRMMELEANVMLKMIEDILQFSRLQNFDYEIELVDTFKIVDGIVSEFQHLYKDIDVVFFVQPDLPTIKANKSLMEQIFKNLISNSVKYCDPEKVRAEVEIGCYKKDGFYHFFVLDNGIGISKEDLPHIFEQFYRVGEKDIEGTGLGMSIVKKIVEYFGGKIWVESEKGKFTKVTFTIPEDM